LGSTDEHSTWSARPAKTGEKLFREKGDEGCARASLPQVYSKITSSRRADLQCRKGEFQNKGNSNLIFRGLRSAGQECDWKFVELGEVELDPGMGERGGFEGLRSARLSSKETAFPWRYKVGHETENRKMIEGGKQNEV